MYISIIDTQKLRTCHKASECTPPLRSTAGNIFGMYLANIFFGKIEIVNLNAKFNINSYIFQVNLKVQETIEEHDMIENK